MGLPIDSTCVAYWKLDELNATDAARDEVGTYSLTYGAVSSGTAPAVTGGRVGSCRSFDGVNNGLARLSAGESDAALLRGDLTVSIWVKPNVAFPWSLPGVLLGFSGNTVTEPDNVQFMLDIGPTGIPRFTWRHGAGINHYNQDAAALPVNSWTHLTAVRKWNGTSYDVSYYWNGTLSVTRAAVTTFAPTGGDGAAVYWMMGRWRFNGSPMKGLLDEARVWRRALGEGEIAAEYERTARLRLNGISLDPYLALGESQRLEPELVGERRRAFGGGQREDVIARRQRWRARTTPLAQSDATPIRSLIEGLGESFPFDADLFSAQGLPPSSSSASIQTTRKKWGAGSALVSGSTTYALGLTGDWSAWGWYRNAAQATPAWEHWLIRSAGSKFKNGVASAEATPWLAVSGGNLVLWPTNVAPIPDYAMGEGPVSVNEYVGAAVGDIYYLYRVTASGDPEYFAGDGVPTSVYGSTFDDSAGYTFQNVGEAYTSVDDLVVVPWLVPDAWVADIYTEHSVRAWTALPTLRASGGLVMGGARTVRGFDRGSSGAPHVRSGTWTAGGEIVELELEDV